MMSRRINSEQEDEVKLDVWEGREGRERLWPSICSLPRKSRGKRASYAGDMTASGDDPDRVWRRRMM
jgi:hypothetical protein